jgi:hypothetical protein
MALATEVMEVIDDQEASNVIRLKNGWHDLPCGGSVEVEDRIPIRVSDKGWWNLDENQILGEAAKLTGTKLTWGDLDRSRRWTKAGLRGIFSGSDKWRWCFAKVLLAPCDMCGDDAGVRWILLPGEELRRWSCEACSRQVELQERIDGGATSRSDD